MQSSDIDVVGDTDEKPRIEKGIAQAPLGRARGGGVQVVIREHTNNAVRWKQGERLHNLIEDACQRFADLEAIVTDNETLTYAQYDRRANQMARYLMDQGVRSGDRVALLFDKSPETYIAMLAVMKVNAAYVPLDAAFPIERVRFILGDAEVSAIVSISSYAERLSTLDVPKILVDADKRAILAKDDSPLTDVPPPIEPLAYIIYTSGTTGNPKGVGIGHASICNFVRVAAELYGYKPGDRIYQGMTIAFDFSIEETWVPMIAGATLIPARSGSAMMGDELGDFLRDRHVTIMACCPTLLATIEQDVPELRLLLVGGEACPHNLVARWYRPGRQILNSYGPTEATVTCTLTELKPDKPVTIGIPLSTYSIVILDPVEDKTMATGELGEIGIAGIGLALGYLNRDELTMKKFIKDFLQIDNNPSGRIYRTGDLGRIDENGEIDYRGRIDTQVKIRGYRIELTEIEQVLLDLPEVAQAAVTTFEPEEGLVEIVAYYAFKHGLSVERDAISQHLRSKLPPYMVPAFLEQLDAIPMTLSNKADHKKLPKPNLQRFAPAEQGYVPPKNDTERTLSTVLAEVLRLERVSTESHFFEDLGANSLIMARFCSLLRKNPDMANVSMRDIYQNPTLADLALHLAGTEETTVVTTREVFHKPSDLSYILCGAGQLAFYALYALFGLWVLDIGYRWAAAPETALAIFARSVVFAAGSFVVLTGISIVVKWLLIGRFSQRAIPIWSFAYYRFWVVMTMMRTSPIAAFYGTPIYNVYLRLMGAKIGRNAVIACIHPPICADVIEIGDNTILRKDSIVLGYRAQSNFIHIAPVKIGDNAFVGEASVLDIDTVMGDNTQLGHASSLQSGQRVPDGKHYHGSPAVETTSDYCQVEGKEASALRHAFFGSVELIALILVAGPLPVLGYHYWEQYSAATGVKLLEGSSILSLFGLSAILYFGVVVLGLASVLIIPRVCNMFLKPNVTYSMFGFHHLMQTIILRVSNARFYTVLFGDSAFITSYMSYVGWNMNTVIQTGSNMGSNQRHDNPFYCNIGTGTMVSDGLSMINTQMSATAFQLQETKIGENSYLGNDIFYPPNGKTGVNVLLATKAMIPIDGPVRENVGILGSPSFEIPRMVDRDRAMNATIDEDKRQEALKKKNVYNLVTALMFLGAQWMSFFIGLVLWSVALTHYDRFGLFGLLFAAGAIVVAYIALFVLLERASLQFGRLKPQLASIYDPYFWHHERHWKMGESPAAGLFPGTPFRPMIYRLLGMKVGRKVFDCSRSITERTLTEVGTYANLNEGSVLQAHSLEEGVFKSDFIRMGLGCTVGPGAFVHYGVTMENHVVLDADSFLMKGETLDDNTGWRGNPAKLARNHADYAQPRSNITIMAMAAE
ncbi:linear gramicidin synthase subunit D [Variibacter gotjawalensis]|uniref:Linear gramicidin synthase subunit D n=1 Tax=Variibacter gotjawalensis TaxID=1333996 RepID=A0A0S3PTW5_9BRAD|nr:Pls/PosA family non-ribosomal peptide synthetase [Variibacter gotjawalensis]NIK49648.1 non-ribosomal peptide synthetase-like protein [Variibacter gotjawalensis]RZS45660.1 non-ribosomal peptide synthetase-like protein [Variibacter gotjawalensis]BAT59331.1 linear gramicidin synthase subunit D [Variibacter gotjawalensis]